MQQRSRDASALLALGLFTTWLWRVGWGLFGALGSDPALWGLTAMDLRVGSPPIVAPMYPGLIAALVWMGAPLVVAGTALSIAAAGCVPAVVSLAVRLGGGSRGAAWAAALLTWASPDLVGFGQQLQPDALTSLGFVAIAAALFSPDPRARWLIVMIGALLPMTRSHGLVALPLVLIALLITPGPRLGPILALGLGAWLSPLLVGAELSWPPWHSSWRGRAGDALGALAARDVRDMPYLGELDAGSARRYLTLVEGGDRLGQIAWHARRSLSLAVDGWALLAVGLSLGFRRGRGGTSPRPPRSLPAVALLLGCALPAALIWSQRRHVMLLAPVAVVVIAVAWPFGRRAGVVAAGLLGVGWLGMSVDVGPRQAREGIRSRHEAALAGWAAERAPAGALWGGPHTTVSLYHPLPRHDPDGSAADWRTLVPDDRPPVAPGTWQRVVQSEGPLAIWQLVEGPQPKPADGALPAPNTPYLTVGPARAVLMDAP